MTDTPEVTTHPHSPHVASAHESGMTFESAMDAVRNGHAVAREDWDSRKWRILQVFYRDQSFIVEVMSLHSDLLQSYAPLRVDRETKDWKVVEYPSLWDPRDQMFGEVQP
jgi:hypothetical protein